MMVSTRESSFSLLLYAKIEAVDLSDLINGSTTFQLHKTLSLRMIPPLFILGKIKSK